MSEDRSLCSLDGFPIGAPYLTFDLDQDITGSLSFINNMNLGRRIQHLQGWWQSVPIKN